MSQTETRENELASAPIGRLLFKMALPCITAQIINALYNIVDRMYIGRMEGTDVYKRQVPLNSSGRLPKTRFAVQRSAVIRLKGYTRRRWIIWSSIMG